MNEFLNHFVRVIRNLLAKSLAVGGVLMLVCVGLAYADSQLSRDHVAPELASWQAEHFEGNDAVLVETSSGQSIAALNSDAPMIPASTLKILTAQIALDRWGGEYHWRTRFIVNGPVLTVVGSGDPYLVSEELLLVAQGLAQHIKQPISKIIIDSSAFADELEPGRSRVNDPYNAPMSALAANFNTVQLRRTANGFVSGEAQTPLTPIALKLGMRAASQESWSVGATKRVNLVTADNSQRQFAELLIEFLKQLDNGSTDRQLLEDNVLIDDFDATESTRTQTNMDGTEYIHVNTMPLSQVLVGALKYSNNFITNQVFLSLDKSQVKSFSGASNTVTHWIDKIFDWSDCSIQDGSGLSADNRISAAQMSEVLSLFSNQQELLPLKEFPEFDAKVFAKTGTLNNVRSLAGYIHVDTKMGTKVSTKAYKFSYFFNRSVPWKHRETTLHALVKQLARTPL
jgi:D-alanyl-D-alanine carboxypeptidase/D-alanyl-D-alanine-endopeptidase (penicillin-binding protein 4)